mmetsp:Transcript_24062/g.90819  ORF Transcript_24062/g.90819 Transcript_24062/m.90819 type:complete len:258 (-) Transcript_24062:83-856(-)
MRIARAGGVRAQPVTHASALEQRPGQGRRGEQPVASSRRARGRAGSSSAFSASPEDPGATCCSAWPRKSQACSVACQQRAGLRMDVEATGSLRGFGKQAREGVAAFQQPANSSTHAGPAAVDGTAPGSVAEAVESNRRPTCLLRQRRAAVQRGSRATFLKQVVHTRKCDRIGAQDGGNQPRVPSRLLAKRALLVLRPRDAPGARLTQRLRPRHCARGWRSDCLWWRRHPPWAGCGQRASGQLQHSANASGPGRHSWL